MSSPQARQRSRPLRSCCQALCCLALVAVVLLGILAWLYFPDTNPPVSSGFRLQQFRITKDPLGLILSGQCDVDFTNRNAYDVLTRASPFAVLYEDRTILKVAYPGSDLPAHRKSHIQIPVMVELTSDPSSVHADVLKLIMKRCLTPKSSMVFAIQGHVSTSTWFLPFWIDIPIRQEKRIPCPSMDEEFMGKFMGPNLPRETDPLPLHELKMDSDSPDHILQQR